MRTLFSRFFNRKKTYGGTRPYREGELTPPAPEPFNWKPVKEFCIGGFLTFIIPIGGGFAAVASNAHNDGAPTSQDIAEVECRTFCEENDFYFWQAQTDRWGSPDTRAGQYLCNCLQNSAHVVHHFLCIEETNTCIYR